VLGAGTLLVGSLKWGHHPLQRAQFSVSVGSPQIAWGETSLPHPQSSLRPLLPVKFPELCVCILDWCKRLVTL
jgi:hypothetical protein